LAKQLLLRPSGGTTGTAGTFDLSESVAKPHWLAEVMEPAGYQNSFALFEMWDQT
jgi:hypothetical protein